MPDGKGNNSMNESYAETAVKRKPTMTSMLIKVLMVAACVFMLLFGMNWFGMFTVAVVGLLVLACVLIFPYLSVEYEYVFCDGQVDFDKIYSGNKRKTATRIDFENVEIMAPAGSHALDSYTHAQVKTLDYTSGSPNGKIFAIMLRQGEQLTRILCEPNEKMLAAIKQKAPRKLSEY